MISGVAFKFKYQNVAQVGERIRAYDFRGKKDSFIEGTIQSVGEHPLECYAAFVVLVDTDYSEGSPIQGRIGMTVYVPLEMCRDYEGRVVKVNP